MNNQQFLSFMKDTFRTNDFISLHEPKFNETDKKFVIDAINSTFVSSVGKYVDQVESQVAKMCKTEKSVAVVNGTSALHMALKVLGVTDNTEVLTQSLTFVATSNAIVYNNASPVYIDVNIDNFGMSPESLLSFLEEFCEKQDDFTINKKSGKRISACVVMHTFGFMGSIDEIKNICDDWKIPLIEDAAEAFGSKYLNNSPGFYSDAAIFSFNGNKIITCGGGGAIVSKNTYLLDRLKYITTTAKKPHKFEYFHDEIGYNYRLPNLNAALLSSQIQQLDEMILQKKNLFEHYNKNFKNTSYNLVQIPAGTTWNYWLMSLKFENRIERDDFLEFTNQNGVMTRPIWVLNHKLPMYSKFQRADLKNSEILEETIVNIPSSAINLI